MLTRYMSILPSLIVVDIELMWQEASPRTVCEKRLTAVWIASSNDFEDSARICSDFRMAMLRILPWLWAQGQ